MNELYKFAELQKLRAEKLKQVQITLPPTGWNGSGTYTQTVQVQGATATNIIICCPEPTQQNIEIVGDCKVLLTGQAVNQLTFTAFEGKPSANLTFNLLVGGEG